MHAALPGGWDSIEYMVSMAGPVVRAKPRLRREDSDTVGTVWPSAELRERAEDVRAAMYRPAEGTWISASWTVTGNGTMSSSYDYDSQPEDDWFAPSAYAEDLARFPRDPEHIPAWLRELLDGHRPDAD